MGNQIPVSSRFTNNEYNLIQEFKKSHKIKNDNQLIRKAVEILMEVRLADAKQNVPFLPTEYTTAYEYHQKLQAEFAKNPRSQKRIDIVFNQWKTEFFHNWTFTYNEKIVKSNKLLDSFDDVRIRGRPKKLKQKRGKPKSKGYGEK